MEKKLTVRSQKLSKSLPQNAGEFSSCIVIEPEEKDLQEKRGSVYAVFDVNSESEQDPLLVTKIVHDVLYDSYYASESASPIQALERAIVDVKEKVTNLPGVSSLGTSYTEFNILAAVMWGNVLYMVQFGKGGSFLIRDNLVKPVNSATEGNFSVASGVVKGGDVVLLGTQEFINVYSAEELVTGSVSFSMHDLKETAAALLLKFDMIADLTEKERINFGYDTRFKENDVSQKELKDKLEKDEKPVRPRKRKKDKEQLPKITLTKAKKKRNLPTVIGAVVLIVLVGSVLYSFLGPGKEDAGADLEDSNTEEMQNDNQEESVDENVEDRSRDVELKIERIDPEVFYDIKLVDEGANPTDIVVLDSEVFVADSNSGKLFVSSSTSPKFEEEAAFSGVKSLNYFGGDITFVDDEGYKVYSKTPGTAGEVVESYEGVVSGPVAPYLAFLYEASDGKITKYELLDTGLSGADWGVLSDTENVVSIAIDGYIYVLKGNEVQKYYSGEKEGFEISTIEKQLNGATKIVKNVDFENMYIADSGNNRILVVADDGTLVKQLMVTDDKFDNITSISVAPDESTIFVLAGSKVFEVAL